MDPTSQPTTHYWQPVPGGGATDPIFAALRQQLGGAAQSPVAGIAQHAVGQAFSSPAMQQALARISPAPWQPQAQGDTPIDWRHVPDTIGHWS